jgi:hypothetical protein
MLTYGVQVLLELLPLSKYADVCWRMLTYGVQVLLELLPLSTNSDVPGERRMQTYADVC